MLNRSKMLQEIDNLLTSEGYKTSNIYDQGSFDLVARKNLLILLLKTFLNIDSINEANAHEMKQLANIFLASPIIIGEKSRNGILEEGAEPADAQTVGGVALSTQEQKQRTQLLEMQARKRTLAEGTLETGEAGGFALTEEDVAALLSSSPVEA